MLTTPVLAGHLADTAPYRWLGSAATLQDSIRHTVEGLGGEGLEPSETADLASYLREGLRPIPNPHAGRVPTALERSGKALFESPELGCAGCHVPERGFQDGALHDVGTSRPRGTSLRVLDPFEPPVVDRIRNGEIFRGFDTPTLRDLRAGAPYLHDGSVPTLESLIVEWNRDDRMGHTSHLEAGDVRALVAYLKTL